MELRPRRKPSSSEEDSSGSYSIEPSSDSFIVPDSSGEEDWSNYSNKSATDESDESSNEIEDQKTCKTTKTHQLDIDIANDVKLQSKALICLMNLDMDTINLALEDVGKAEEKIKELEKAHFESLSKNYIRFERKSETMKKRFKSVTVLDEDEEKEESGSRKKKNDDKEIEYLCNLDNIEKKPRKYKRKRISSEEESEEKTKPQPKKPKPKKPISEDEKDNELDDIGNINDCEIFFNLEERNKERLRQQEFEKELRNMGRISPNHFKKYAFDLSLHDSADDEDSDDEKKKEQKEKKKKRIKKTKNTSVEEIKYKPEKRPKKSRLEREVDKVLKEVTSTENNVKKRS